MVCRENKLRSAVMGYEKHLLRDLGLFDYHDRDVQSGIHEYGHAYVGAKDATPDEYMAVMLGVRQQIVDDPGISEADKFRVSEGRGGQPGLVTRIDQEIARFKSGKDERGNPLRPEQRNGGAQLAAMKRLGVLLQRRQEPRRLFIENYARSMGVPIEQSRARYDDLVSRKPEDRTGTKIRLTDDWRDTLAVSGLTAQQQADIGQDNATRYAIRVMESERTTHLRTLPTRPTIRDEDRLTFLSKKDPNVQVQCRGEGGCGQFGHERDNCPNTAEVQAVAAATAAYDSQVQEAQRHLNARDAAAALTSLEAGEPYGFDLNSDGKHWVLDPRQATAVAGPGVLSDVKYMPAGTPEAEAMLREVAASGDPNKASDAVLEAKEAGVAVERAQDALEEKRGPVPLVSNAVQNIGYNPDSGLVEITAHPYTRKKTGEVMPPKTYAYRMSREEHAEMMAYPDGPGAYVSRNFFGRRRDNDWNAQYAWENTAEAAEASVQRQCSSCGQFASLTSAHKCPIDGSMDSRYEAEYRERLRQDRVAANLSKLPARMRPQLPRTGIGTQVQGRLVDGGVLAMPGPQQTIQARDSGKIAIGGFNGQYLGHRVTGRIYTWNEPGTGIPLTTTDNVNCTCGGPPCRHAAKAIDTMTASYRATKAPGISPGQRRFLNMDTPVAAHDAPARDFTRVSYDTIRNRRRDAAATQNRVFAEVPSRRTVVGHPIDARTGQPTNQPQTWRGPGSRVDVRSPWATAATLAENLQESTKKNWDVRVNEADGTIQITAPPTRTRKGAMSDSDQRALAGILGIRGRTGAQGVHVPSDPSWRYEMLERSAGHDPEILGARFVARTVKDAAGPQA